MLKSYKYFYLLIICTSMALPGFAQQATKQVNSNNNNLFSAGFAAGFIGGLYDAFYPYKQLLKQGDFGLGAPNKLDGELLLLNGKLYQTQATGKTTQLTDTGKTPYAVVCFFQPKKVYKKAGELTKAGLFSYLDSLLTNTNGIYAIHIKGKFKLMKTRAFPHVEKPYLPLAAMLDRQHFFNHTDVDGDLVGFRTPAFMEGAHITGYHFHFLSTDKAKGGHMIDLTTQDITVEVDILNSYTMQLPQTTDFNNFDFKKDRKDDIKSVENGKKQ